MQTASVGLDPAKLEEDGGEDEVGDYDGDDRRGPRFPLIPRLISAGNNKKGGRAAHFCRFRLGLCTELDITRRADPSLLADLQEAAGCVPDNQPQRCGTRFVRAWSRHEGEGGAEQPHRRVRPREPCHHRATRLNPAAEVNHISGIVICDA